MSDDTAGVSVALVDDQQLIRTGLRMVVESAPGLHVAWEAGDGQEALTRARAHPVDVILMDVRMPVLDGIAATKVLVREQPKCRVLVLTTYDSDDHAYAAIRAGASGFLLKDAPAEELWRAIDAVQRGDAVLAPSVTRRILDEMVQTSVPRTVLGLDRLTDREREILLQMATGASNAEIARTLHLSTTTVKTHVTRVLTKLGLRDRIQAVVLAYEAGLIRPGHRPHGNESHPRG